MNCGNLTGRLRAICEGTSGLPEAKRAAYMALWAERGLLDPADVPERPAPPTADSLPCIHRGAWLTDAGCCGALYQCRKFRKCSIRRNSMGLAACVTCEAREPGEGKSA
jgi:hypothetical protein